MFFYIITLIRSWNIVEKCISLYNVVYKYINWKKVYFFYGIVLFIIIHNTVMYYYYSYWLLIFKSWASFTGSYVPSHTLFSPFLSSNYYLPMFLVCDFQIFFDGNIESTSGHLYGLGTPFASNINIFQDNGEGSNSSWWGYCVVKFWFINTTKS